MTEPICTSHWCLVMSFCLKVCIYSHTRGVKLGLGLGFMQTSQVLPHWLNQSFSFWILSSQNRFSSLILRLWMALLRSFHSISIGLRSGLDWDTPKGGFYVSKAIDLLQCLESSGFLCGVLPWRRPCLTYGWLMNGDVNQL